VDRVQRRRLEHHWLLSAPPTKCTVQLVLPYVAHTGPAIQFVLVAACLGKKKSSDNHYIGKNANKQTKKSNQHKVGKQSQLVVTLFCLASRQRVGIHCSRHYTTGSLLFRVIHINIVLPFAR